MNKKIVSEELLHIAADLVKIPSYSFLENSEKATAEYIAQIFQREGIETEIVEVLAGRPNVYGVLRGSGGGKSLMLSGHLDTVPAYGMENPFSGEIRDGRLYGRGACDMKGPLAAMIYALICLKREGIRLKGDLYFTGVIDEEEKGKGVEELIKHGPYTDGAIVGEPTQLKMAIGNKGLEWIDIEVYGKTVHGGEMEKGINAISKAVKLIKKVEDEYLPKLREKKHPVLGSPTLNFGTISGGDQPSTVPGICRMKVDRRWIPGETRDQVYDDLRSIIKEIEREDPQFHAELWDVFEKDDLLPHQPFFTAESDPLIQATREAMGLTAEALGVTLNSESVIMPAWSDAGYLSNYTETSCIVLGPGDLTLAHSAGESIGVEELQQAAELYKMIAIKYCALAD